MVLYCSYTVSVFTLSLLAPHFFYVFLQQSVRAFKHPGFVLHLVLDDKDIKFEPEFELLEEALLNVYDLMLRSASMVPRVDTKLYDDMVSVFKYCITFRTD